MPRALTVALAVLCVPLLAVVVWSVWVYTTWALQARTAGWVTALSILAVLIGIGAWWNTRSTT